jgi:tRNA (guanine10-N2)-methyltransferase
MLISSSEEGYIPPKRPYSFLAMLDDILDFAALSLVDGGRISFWMPTANDQDQEIQIPKHPYLQITSVCTQEFNRCKGYISPAGTYANNYQGSRRLITYRRIPDSEVVAGVAREQRTKVNGVNADDLNPFRKGYFQGFKSAFR